MKHYETQNIKNIVLVGGSKSGKTTLAECMMFEGGVTGRMGTIEDHNTVSDYHEIEQERENSVYSSIMHTEWRGNKINIVDTPGMDDFIGEMISALRVSDTALLLLNNQNGVEVGTEIAWRYLKKFNKPTIFVANQADHAKADFNATAEQAKAQFGNKVIVVQYPYNNGEGFDSIIDVLKMVMYKFPAEGGKPEKLPIPDEEKAKADELHNILVETAAENDDALMELYFEKGSLDEDEMRKGIRIGMLKRELFPLFCLSAKRNMGSGRLMGFINNVAPSADDMNPEESTDGTEINCSDPDTSLFVFKASNEKHAGSMSFFKVCSGTLSTGMDLINTTTNSKGRISQLYVVDGKNRTPVEKLSAGDIGATVKFKGTFTNHTLRSKDDGLQIKPIDFPPSKMRTAIVPAKQGDEEKLGQGLNKIHECDPTLIIEQSKELKQTLVHSQGELHMLITKNILKNEHGVDVEFVSPRIPYRETIQKEAKASYRHKKQSGGSGQFGEVYLAIAPYYDGMPPPEGFNLRKKEEIELSWGGKLVYYNCIVGGVIDNRFMPAILKGIMERIEEGPLTGSYARDICVMVYDGKMHPVDSNEISFKIAGKHAFKEAFVNAQPKIMEPIYRVEVLVPDDYTGDVMTDLQSRRALVEGIEAEGAYQKIIARVPLAELNRYSSSLRSISQGRAIHTREFLEYAQTPGDVQQKLIKAHEAGQA